MDRQALIDYIRQSAVARGIDPDIAVRVAESEGLNANPAEGWQSMVVKDGKREESYGPFQLYMGGGLGNVFQEQTGLDPRDPSTVTQQIDFALDQATKSGWGPWYGAARVGVGNREGLPGSGSSSSGATRRVATASDPDVQALVEQGVDLPLALAAVERSRFASASGEQEDSKSGIDSFTDALSYLDLMQLAQEAGPPSMDAPGVYRPREGSGSQALKRLGLASLV
jgi:hypothetical protein